VGWFRPTATLVRAAASDPRLFDVTGLLADGYGDGRADLRSSRLRQRRHRTVVRWMTSVKPRAAHAARRSEQAVVRPETQGATGKVCWTRSAVTGAEGVQQIGTPAVWQAGFTGKGVTVALIDSGVDVTIPTCRADRRSGRFLAGETRRRTCHHGCPRRRGARHARRLDHGRQRAASGGRYRRCRPDATSCREGRRQHGDRVLVIAAMNGGRHAARERRQHEPGFRTQRATIRWKPLSTP